MDFMNPDHSDKRAQQCNSHSAAVCTCYTNKREVVFFKPIGRYEALSEISVQAFMFANFEKRFLVVFKIYIYWPIYRKWNFFTP